MSLKTLRWAVPTGRVSSGSASTRAKEWEASKAYIRGKMIAHSSKKKKEDMRRIK